MSAIEWWGVGSVGAALIAIIVMFGYAAGFRETAPCLRYETQMVVTYPNAGLLGLGPQYTGIALAPQFVPMQVCVERVGH